MSCVEFYATVGEVCDGVVLDGVVLDGAGVVVVEVYAVCSGV
jgi:hypothetical protein